MVSAGFRLSIATATLCAALFVARSPAAADEPDPSALSVALFDNPVAARTGQFPLSAWRSVFARAHEELTTPGDMPKGWDKFVGELTKLDFKARLERANLVLNRVPYVTAVRNWGNPWRWESPAEFLARGGQCEDYAIAKYFALRGAGVPASVLRIVVVEDMVDRVTHAVLIAGQDQAAYVLDNRVDTVASADKVERYRPLYGFNEASWWVYADTAAPRRPAAP
jgi:predicted transglutaminase-like cysteine proteinase